MQRDNWHCSLCGQWNEVAGTRPTTLATRRGDHRYPEMNRHWAEFKSGDSDKHQIIAHVIVLDLAIASAASNASTKAARLHYFQAVRKGLTTAIQNMCDNAYVALMCVDDSAKVTVCDLHGMQTNTCSSSSPLSTSTTSTTSTTPDSTASTAPPTAPTAPLSTPPLVPRYLKSFVSKKTGALLTPLVDMLQGTKFACNVGRRRHCLLAAVHTLLDRAIAATTHIVPLDDTTVQQHCAHKTATATRACILGLMEYLSSPPPSSSSCRGDPTYVQSIVAARVSIVTPGWSVVEQPQKNLEAKGMASTKADWTAVQQAMSTCGVCVDVYHGDAGYQQPYWNDGNNNNNNNNADGAVPLMQLMSQLSLSTGGRIRTYTHAMDQYESASFDLSTSVGARYAACGVLQVRTSDGFQVVVPPHSQGSEGNGNGGGGNEGSNGGNNGSGNDGTSGRSALGWSEVVNDVLGVDVQFHLAGCDRSTCFPLSFTTEVSFGSASSSAATLANPVVQLCFVYYAQAPPPQERPGAESDEGDFGDDYRSRRRSASTTTTTHNVVQKWTRVITIRCGSTAQTPRQAMAQADTASLFYILTHQVLAAELATDHTAQDTSKGNNGNKGGKDIATTETPAGQLLFDWLVYLTSSYYRHVLGAAGNTQDQHLRHVVGCHDRSLLHLTPLTQLVYGTLHFLKRRREQRRRRQTKPTRQQSNPTKSQEEKQMTQESSPRNNDHNVVLDIMAEVPQVNALDDLEDTRNDDEILELLTLTPNELMRRMYPSVVVYDQNYRKLSNKNQDNSNDEPLALLEWSSLNNTMSMHPHYIVLIDAGNAIHLARNGQRVTVQMLQDEETKKSTATKHSRSVASSATTIEMQLTQRRLTSSSAPMVCNATNDALGVAWIQRNCCLNDGVGGGEATYLSFTGKLVDDIQTYLAKTA